MPETIVALSFRLLVILTGAASYGALRAFMFDPSRFLTGALYFGAGCAFTLTTICVGIIVLFFSLTKTHKPSPSPTFPAPISDAGSKRRNKAQRKQIAMAQQQQLLWLAATKPQPSIYMKRRLQGTIWTIPVSAWPREKVPPDHPPLSQGSFAISHKWDALVADGVLTLVPAAGQDPHWYLSKVEVPLEGCSCTVVQECLMLADGKKMGPWHKRGPLELRHPTQPFLYGEYSVFIYLETGAAKEQWHLALVSESSPTGPQATTRSMYQSFCTHMKRAAERLALPQLPLLPLVPPGDAQPPSQKMNSKDSQQSDAKPSGPNRRIGFGWLMRLVPGRRGKPAAQQQQQLKSAVQSSADLLKLEKEAAQDGSATNAKPDTSTNAGSGAAVVEVAVAAAELAEVGAVETARAVPGTEAAPDSAGSGAAAATAAATAAAAAGTVASHDLHCASWALTSSAEPSFSTQDLSFALSQGSPGPNRAVQPNREQSTSAGLPRVLSDVSVTSAEAGGRAGLSGHDVKAGPGDGVGAASVSVVGTGGGGDDAGVALASVVGSGSGQGTTGLQGSQVNDAVVAATSSDGDLRDMPGCLPLQPGGDSMLHTWLGNATVVQNWVSTPAGGGTETAITAAPVPPPPSEPDHAHKSRPAEVSERASALKDGDELTAQPSEAKGTGLQLPIVPLVINWPEQATGQCSLHLHSQEQIAGQHQMLLSEAQADADVLSVPSTSPGRNKAASMSVPDLTLSRLQQQRRSLQEFKSRGTSPERASPAMPDPAQEAAKQEAKRLIALEEQRRREEQKRQQEEARRQQQLQQQLARRAMKEAAERQKQQQREEASRQRLFRNKERRKQDELHKSTKRDQQQQQTAGLDDGRRALSVQPRTEPALSTDPNTLREARMKSEPGEVVQSVPLGGSGGGSKDVDASGPGSGEARGGDLPGTTPDPERERGQLVAGLMGLNMLLTRVGFEILGAQRLERWLHRFVQKKLDEFKRPAYLHPLKLETLDLGSTFPMVRNIRAVAPASDHSPGSCMWPQLVADVAFSGRITLVVSTTVELQQAGLIKKLQAAFGRMAGIGGEPSGSAAEGLTRSGRRVVSSGALNEMDDLPPADGISPQASCKIPGGSATHGPTRTTSRASSGANLSALDSQDVPACSEASPAEMQESAAGIKGDSADDPAAPEAGPQASSDQPAPSSGGGNLLSGLLGLSRAAAAKAGSLAAGLTESLPRVPCQLELCLTRFECELMVWAAPPPSDRVWLCFASPPMVEISTRPLFGNRVLRYSAVLSQVSALIRAKLLKAINRLLVYPASVDIKLGFFANPGVSNDPPPEPSSTPAPHQPQPKSQPQPEPSPLHRPDSDTDLQATKAAAADPMSHPLPPLEHTETMPASGDLFGSQVVPPPLPLPSGLMHLHSLPPRHPRPMPSLHSHPVTPSGASPSATPRATHPTSPFAVQPPMMAPPPPPAPSNGRKGLSLAFRFRPFGRRGNPPADNKGKGTPPSVTPQSSSRANSKANSTRSSLDGRTPGPDAEPQRPESLKEA